MDSSPVNMDRFLRDVLVRTNFIPAVRYFIGWRGIKDASCATEAWTAKIRNHPGVFGVACKGSHRSADGSAGRFDLFYFPDPEEDLLEQYSLMANHLAQREDYIPCVRNFLQYPGFADLFGIGHLTLSATRDEICRIGVLTALSSKQSIIDAGVRLPYKGRYIQLVEPGGCDENIPAFALAAEFLDVFGASLAFHLQTPPSCLWHEQSPGCAAVVSTDGRRRMEPREGIARVKMMIGFGDSDRCRRLLKSDNPQDAGTIIAHWRAGEEPPEMWRHATWWQATAIPLQQTVDKTFLGMDERPPLMILTGFLGSGKTSFLRHFIEYQTSRQRFVAVIQNEIGETGLDGKLVEDHFTVAEIDEGCVCCTLAGNLKKAVQSILSQFRPDYIVLETTGLANPYNLLDDLSDLQDLIRFDTVTTLVDACHVVQAMQESAVVREQIRAADVMLLNKIDLVEPADLQELTIALEAINPRAPIVHGCHGDIHPNLLYGIDPLETSWAGEGLPAKSTARHGTSTHLDDGIAGHKVTLLQPVERTRFIAFIEKKLPAKLLRIKGIIQFDDAAKPIVFQYVRGRYAFSELVDQRFEERFLVFIGKHLQPAAIEEALQSENISVSGVKR